MFAVVAVGRCTVGEAGWPVEVAGGRVLVGLCSVDSTGDGGVAAGTGNMLSTHAIAAASAKNRRYTNRPKPTIW